MIKRGLATGDNSFFILKRETAQALEIPTDCLRPILPSPRYVKDAVILSDKDGYPKTDPQLALIDCRLSEERLKSKFPAFWDYLESGKANSVHTGYLASRRIPWYSQERRDPAPFLCTYMGRSREKRANPFRVIWNQSKAVASNVYLMLYPKPALQSALDQDPSLYERLFVLLNQIGEDAFTSEGRVYGGGLHKVEPAELQRVEIGSIDEIVTLPVKKTQKRLALL
jgi:hypothetical protein